MGDRLDGVVHDEADQHDRHQRGDPVGLSNPAQTVGPHDALKAERADDRDGEPDQREGDVGAGAEEDEQQQHDDRKGGEHQRGHGGGGGVRRLLVDRRRGKTANLQRAVDAGDDVGDLQFGRRQGICVPERAETNR